jgi:hypothetical protein
LVLIHLPGPLFGTIHIGSDLAGQPPPGGWNNPPMADEEPEPRITLQVTAKLDQRIREQAAAEDRSVSSLIRRAVVAYLDAQQPPRGR